MAALWGRLPTPQGPIHHIPIGWAWYCRMACVAASQDWHPVAPPPALRICLREAARFKPYLGATSSESARVCSQSMVGRPCNTLGPRAAASAAILSSQRLVVPDMCRRRYSCTHDGTLSACAARRSPRGSRKVIHSSFTARVQAKCMLSAAGEVLSVKR